MNQTEVSIPTNRGKCDNTYTAIEDLEGVIKRLIDLRLEMVGEQCPESRDEQGISRSLAHLLDYAPRRIGELVSVVENEIDNIRDAVL